MWRQIGVLAVVIGSHAALPAAALHYRPIDAWEAFNKQTALQCRSLDFASAPAGDVNYMQEGFYGTLDKRQAKVFNDAIPRNHGGPASCAKRNGVSCPTAWNMLAIEKAGLLTGFVKYACAHGDRLQRR